MDSSAGQIIESAIGASGVSEDVAGYAIDGLRPKVVAFPASVEELGRVMRAAHEAGLVVAPWGGGTRTSIGNRLARLDVVVDLSRLNRVVQHTPADLTATFDAGVAFSDAQRVLGEHGQLLAIDPPLPDRATIGGTLASGASGPLKWQLGHPRDTVIGMKVVQADGTVTKSGGQVVKNVSGYDMARLHVGGLGTLGIIAEVSFKLTPKPRNEATVVAAFESSRDCLKAALSIFHSYLMPLALVSFDEAVSERAGVSVAGGHYFLAARLGGRPRTVERQAQECLSICRASGAKSVDGLDDVQALALWRRIADFGWSEPTTPLMSGRISILPTKVSEIISKIEQLDGDLQPAIVSHPAYGSVMASWFGDGAAGQTLRRALDAAHEAGGRMVVEQCPLEVKDGFDVWDVENSRNGEAGESLAIIRRMKAQYDPDGILNPGRFAGRI